MNQVSKPFLHVALTDSFGGHVKRSLSQERLRIRWHVGQVVHDNKHLHHGAEGVEQRDLDGTLWRHSVTLFAQIDVA